MGAPFLRGFGYFFDIFAVCVHVLLFYLSFYTFALLNTVLYFTFDIWGLDSHDKRQSLSFS